MGGVLAPDSLRGRKDVLVLICSAQLNVQKAVSTQLENLGIDSLTVDEYVFAKRKEEILKCAELLADEESVETYTEIIESRLMGRLPSKKFIRGDQYFTLPEFRIVSEKEVFVDCGAFVGDSIERYIWTHDGTFGKIVAFEPDAISYRAMESRVERLNKEWAFPVGKIQMVAAGTGNKTIDGTIEHKGLSSIISEQQNLNGESIKIYALDDFFSDSRINFLKADIESFELDMLKGAEKIIRRDLPKIAVCIYHNASDMYQILLWLNNLDLGYKFSIRHPGSLFIETVLYAYQ